MEATATVVRNPIVVPENSSAPDSSNPGDSQPATQDDEKKKLVPPPSITYRISVPLLSHKPVEFDFQELVKKEYPAPQPEVKKKEPLTGVAALMDLDVFTGEAPPPEEEGEELESSEPNSPTVDTSRNRLTSVIDNIARMYEDGMDDLGYDREDSFIDDSDIVHAEDSSRENAYGGFFIHKGELTTVKRKRTDEESKRTKRPRLNKEKKVEKKEVKREKKEEKKEKKEDKKEKKEPPKESKVPSPTTQKEPGKEIVGKEVKEAPIPTGSAKLSDKVEQLAKALQDAWDKVPDLQGKQKRFPAELDPVFYQLCKTAKEEQGYLSQALCDRLKFLPFAIPSLKARFKKFETVDSRISQEQQNLQEYVEKLKIKIQEIKPENIASLDAGIQDLLYSVITSKKQSIAAHADKRKLEGPVSSLTPPPNELPEFCKRIGGFFSFPMTDKDVERVYNLVKKSKAQEEKKTKEAAKQVQQTGTVPQTGTAPTVEKKVTLTERRKKKLPADTTPVLPEFPLQQITL